LSTTPELLSSRRREERYAEERRQGELIATTDESAWGWTGPAGTIRADRRGTFLIEQGRLAPGVKCLELGCGTGEFTQRIVTSGCDLTAVEISEMTAQRCRDRVGPSANVIIGNIETGEGLEGLQFDAIVGISVLHHVNLDLCFQAAFKLLKPGGRFAFVEPNMANPQVWAERHIGFVKKMRHVTAHETAFIARQLRAVFERAGLVVETCEPFEFLHPSTPKPLVPMMIGLERALSSTPLVAIAGSVRIAGHKPRA
jgi:SAM-dependent methyltransferase